MTVLAITRDINGVPTYGLPFSSENQCFTLESNTQVSITAPTRAKKYAAVFSYEPGSKVWVSLESITLPDTTPAATQAQLNPAVREIMPGETLYFNTNDVSAEVGVSFYEL